MSWLKNGCAVLPAPDWEWLNRGLSLLKVGLPSLVLLSTLEKGARMPVMIGVDPHKASHTAAVLDEHGQLLDRQCIPASLDGYQTLCAWAARWPERRWAVEGAHGIGRALAQRLVGDGEQVLDVPAKLAARVRVLSVGHGRNSDFGDAISVAITARSVPSLRRVGVEDQATVLHLLTKRRQDLVAARTGPSTGCTGCCWTWSPAAPDGTSPPTAPPRCSLRSRLLVRRRSPAGSWPPSS